MCETKWKANETLPKVEKRKKKEWMTEEILKLMEDGKAAKTKDEMSYKNLSKKIKAECNKAKEGWLDQQCLLIEQLNKESKSKSLHREMKISLGHAPALEEETLKTETKVYSLKNSVS